MDANDFHARGTVSELRPAVTKSQDLKLDRARTSHGTAQNCDKTGRGRANSRRGLSDTDRRSYPAVESVRRALEILRVVNRLRIASIADIHRATGLPKPSIVRLLETLMVDGYVARDNLHGGYRVTCRTRELNAGYDGISMVIEASRALAIELTHRLKWPIGIGVRDGSAMSVQFWTGAISPWAHTNTVLGLRPSLLTSAMGRAYMAFCPDDERTQLLAKLRADEAHGLTAEKENQFRNLLTRIRQKGYAMRDPRTDPQETITLAMPLCFGGRVIASISISLYKTAVPRHAVQAQIVDELRATQIKIENNLSLLMREASLLPG